MKIFNKNFFHLLFGFVSIIFFGLSVVFVASFYQIEILSRNKSKRNEVALPVKTIMQNNNNSGATGAISANAEHSEDFPF